MSKYEVTPFYNEAAGGSFATAGSIQRAEANAAAGRPRVPMWGGYEDGDLLIVSSVGTLDVEAGNRPAAAEYIFDKLNRDDRPNGKIERSFSVGDVVRVRAAGTRDRWFAIASVGTEEITEPSNVREGAKEEVA